MFKFNKSSGQASRALLVLAIIIFVAVIITYLVVQMAQKPTPPPDNEPIAVEMVYEAVIGNIRFIFENALDKGKVLRASEIENERSYAREDLATTEKFIKVTVGAQNVGKENTEQRAWNLENIVDSEGRNYVPMEDYYVRNWLPEPDLCGSLLKPAFDPTPCTKIYEVSKEATGLKVRVMTGRGNASEYALLDLIVK